MKMRTAIAALLALTLGAQGQTLSERVTALISSNRTVEYVGGFPKVTPTGDWDAADMKSATTELLALSRKDMLAIPNALGFLTYRESVSKVESDRLTIITALESIHGGPDANAKQKATIAGRLIIRLPSMTLPRAKSILASMPFDNNTAATAGAMAGRFADPKLRDDWFAQARTKGISRPSYRAWFRETLAATADPDKPVWIQQEIAGLVRNGSDINQSKDWIDELRYRLYVAREVQ